MRGCVYAALHRVFSKPSSKPPDSKHHAVLPHPTPQPAALGAAVFGAGLPLIPAVTPPPLSDLKPRGPRAAEFGAPRPL